MVKDKNAARKRQARENIKPEVHSLIVKVVDRGCTLLEMRAANKARMVHYIEQQHKQKPLPLTELLAAEDAEFLQSFRWIMLP